MAVVTEIDPEGERKSKKKRRTSEVKDEDEVVSPVKKVKTKSQDEEMEEEHADGKKNGEIIKNGVSKKKGRADWTCTQCSTINYVKSKYCKKCKTFKSGCGKFGAAGNEQSDWKCAGCAYFNVATRSHCKQCDQLCKDPVVGGHWQCKVCQFDMFSPTLKCKPCITKKEEAERWKCDACGCSNFSSKVLCGDCKKPNPAINEGKKWEWHCECGTDNFLNRSTCRQGGCNKPNPNPVKEHLVQMNDVPRSATKSDIEQFFAPLEVVRVWFTKKSKATRLNLNNALVVFNSLKDCKKANKKNGEKMGDFTIKLVVKTDEEKASAKIKKEQDHEDEGDTTINVTSGTLDKINALDDTMGPDVSISKDKKKFKWDKLMKICFTSTGVGELSAKKLCKILLPQYNKQMGEEVSKEEFMEKLEKRLENSAKFSYQGGKVTLSS